MIILLWVWGGGGEKTDHMQIQECKKKININVIIRYISVSGLFDL